MKFFKLEIELLFSKNKKNLPDKISPPNLSLGADRLLSSYATVLEQVTWGERGANKQNFKAKF